MEVSKLASIAVGVFGALFVWRSVVRPMKLGFVGLKSAL